MATPEPNSAAVAATRTGPTVAALQYAAPWQAVLG